MAGENYIPFYKKGGADTRVNHSKPDNDYLGSSGLSKELNVSDRPDFVKTNQMLENSTNTNSNNSTSTRTKPAPKTKKGGSATKTGIDPTGSGNLVKVQPTKANNSNQTTAASLEGTGNKSASNSSWIFNKSAKETVVAFNDRKAMKQEFRRRKKTGYDPQTEGKIVSDYASKDDKGAYKSETAEWGRLDEKNKRLADKLNKKLDKKLDKPTGSRSKLFKPTSGNNPGPTPSTKNNGVKPSLNSGKYGKYTDITFKPTGKGTKWDNKGLNSMVAARKELDPTSPTYKDDLKNINKLITDTRLTLSSNLASNNK